MMSWVTCSSNSASSCMAPIEPRLGVEGRGVPPKLLQGLANHVILGGITPGEHLIVDETLKISGQMYGHDVGSSS